MKYALLQMSTDKQGQITIVEYKHYAKYKRNQKDNFYIFIGVLESNFSPSELIQGFSAVERDKTEYYKNQLRHISRFINI